MAIISAGKGSHSAARSIRYVQFEKKSTNYRAIFSEGIDCSADYQAAIQDFQNVRNTYNKHGGREAHHMVISFSPEEEQRFTQESLFQKAVDIAKHTFPDYQIWLGMHDDTDHLHVHMIINSVNLNNGRKMQIAGRKGMHEIMKSVQEKCFELGLDEPGQIGKSIQEEGKVKTHNIVEYKLISKGISWKLDMAKTIYSALNNAKSKSDFIFQCNENGIFCKWDDKHKYITFSYIDDPSKKVRNSNLAKTFTLERLQSKETMQNVFDYNRKLTERDALPIEVNSSKNLERERLLTINREQSIGLRR